MGIKDISDEGSGENEEKWETGGKKSLVIWWQKAELNCILQLRGKQDL